MKHQRVYVLLTWDTVEARATGKKSSVCGVYTSFEAAEKHAKDLGYPEWTTLATYLES